MLIYLQMLESDEDKLKFEQLYTHYKGLMFRVAYDILQNKQDAEDAVHLSFLSVIENFQKISGIDCPKTKSFLVIIVERKAIDILRKRSKFTELFDDAQYGIEVPLPGDNGLADPPPSFLPDYCELGSYLVVPLAGLYL